MGGLCFPFLFLHRLFCRFGTDGLFAPNASSVCLERMVCLPRTDDANDTRQQGK